MRESLWSKSWKGQCMIGHLVWDSWLIVHFPTWPSFTMQWGSPWYGTGTLHSRSVGDTPSSVWSHVDTCVCCLSLYDYWPCNGLARSEMLDMCNDRMKSCGLVTGVVGWHSTWWLISMIKCGMHGYGTVYALVVVYVLHLFSCFSLQAWSVLCGCKHLFTP